MRSRATSPCAVEAVAAGRAPRREQLLILEVADLRDRDVRELVLERLADGADRHRLLRARRARVRRIGAEPRVGRLVGRCMLSAAQERQLVLADLHLVAVLEALRVDPAAVDVGAVQRAESSRYQSSPRRTSSAWSRETVTSSRKTRRRGGGRSSSARRRARSSRPRGRRRRGSTSAAPRAATCRRARRARARRSRRSGRSPSRLARAWPSRRETHRTSGSSWRRRC